MLATATRKEVGFSTSRSNFRVTRDPSAIGGRCASHL